MTWGPGGTADCVAAFVGMGGFDGSLTGMGVTGGQGAPCYRPGASAAAAMGPARGRLSGGGGEYRFN